MSSVGDYEETNVREKKKKCDKFRRFLSYREHPIQGKTLDNDCPSIFCWYIRCPPHSFPGWGLTRLLLAFLSFVLVNYFCETELDPNYEYVSEVRATILGMFIVYAAARFMSFLLRTAHLPDILGMLLAGFVLSNCLPFIRTINRTTKEILNDFAFSIILVRAGLSLNLATFKQMGCTIVLLATTPGVVVEATIVAMMAWTALDFTLAWAYMFGFIICGISPAIIVPTMLKIQQQGYDNGLPPLIITAASMDDISALFAYSLISVPAFENEKAGTLVLVTFAWTVACIAIALLLSGVFWWVPPQTEVETEEKYISFGDSGRNNRIRFFLLLLAALSFIIVSKFYNQKGVGPLASVVTAFVSSIRWPYRVKQSVSASFADAWSFVAPLLFGLVGTELILDELIKMDSMRVLGISEFNEPKVLIIIFGVVIRCVWAFVVTKLHGMITCCKKRTGRGRGNRPGGLVGVQWSLPNNVESEWSLKECIFVALAWCPKATVQAIMGRVPLSTLEEKAEESGDPEQYREDHKHEFQMANDILKGSLLSILLCAPVGLIFIKFTYKKLMKNTFSPIIRFSKTTEYRSTTSVLDTSSSEGFKKSNSFTTKQITV
ncbi:sodium/hydrogen exchanger 9B1-like [Symsagittifera roscoffensis]|uniref:sodium/hydrogen exchanger 9B1-like n=1 Tax=Symsagittifera roscoffensis TaxID=84072 RepID=UPI00307C6B48